MTEQERKEKFAEAHRLLNRATEILDKIHKELDERTSRIV